MERSVLEQQLKQTLEAIDVPGLGNKIAGKVRDSYVVGDKRVLIASDRLSAFDRILTSIPFKGQLLTQMAAYWFEETKHIVENHVISHPHPNVMITEEVKIVPIEVVIRGYLTGSAWRDYKAGKDVSGVPLPAGLRKSEKFKEPLITPSTKAEQGEHDMPISSAEVVVKGIVEESLWNEICDKAMALFRFGSEKALERGLILVDTKYEFGTRLGSQGKPEVVLADEVHTPDSSRYWMLDSYQERFEAGQDPHMLDKEFVRTMLMERHGYMGDGEMPTIEDDFRVDTALRYIEAYEMITGSEFAAEAGSPVEKIKESLQQAL